MDRDDRRRVLDPTRDAAALKALTHPLRIELLGLLRQFGPATASELAARTAESSASASYHLRVLAKYAFIEEAEHRDGRERRWKSVHQVTSWDNREMEGDPVGQAFVGMSRRAQARHLIASADRYDADLAAGRLDPEWSGAGDVGDLIVRLTPESLAELQQLFDDKAEELRRRDEADPRARQVALILASLPRADAEVDAEVDVDAEPTEPGVGAADIPDPHIAADSHPARTPHPDPHTTPDLNPTPTPTPTPKATP